MTLQRSALSPALALLVAALALPPSASGAPQTVADLPGGHYVLDKKHASVIAKVMHMGVSFYTVRFDAFDASFDYDPSRPDAARVQATVQASSLDVNADYSQKFAEDFLSAGKFPLITFVSRQVTPGPGNTGTMTGDLTLMGVTKPATFDVTFVGTGHELLNPLGRTAGFSAVTTIKRSDFGSTYLDNVVGDEVTIQIEGEFDRR
jgi:polyisoprenoid-binding protein YceI